MHSINFDLLTNLQVAMYGFLLLFYSNFEVNSRGATSIYHKTRHNMTSPTKPEVLINNLSQRRHHKRVDRQTV